MSLARPAAKASGSAEDSLATQKKKILGNTHMKKHLIMLLIFLTASLAFGDVTIGTGTETGGFPLNDLYKYSRTQCIYTAAEINVPAGGTITHLKWYRDDVGANPNAIGTTRIWISETSLTTLSAWQPEGTLVATITNIDLGTGGDWFTVDISDFVYTGSNLMVSVRTQNAPYTAPHAYWRCTSTSPHNRSLVGRSDTVNPPAVSTTYYRPNITLVGITSTVPLGFCTASAPADGATAVSITPTLSWIPGSGVPTGYDVYFGTTLPPDGSPNVSHTTQTTTSWAPGTLQTNTTYYWKIVPHNIYGSPDPASCPVWSFTTREDQILYTQDFDSGTSLASIDWAGTMTIMANHGKNGSNGLSRNLYSGVPTCNAVSPQIGPLTADCQIMFDYRYLEYNGYPANPYTPGIDDKLEIQVSYNGGAYNTIHTINQSNHVPSTAFATVIVPLVAHAGELVRVKFLSTWRSGDYYLDIDNVSLRETPSTAVFNLFPSVNSWNFGTIIVNVPVTKTFIVTNTGVTDLTFSSVSVNGLYYSEAGGFDISPLPAMGSRNFTVKFQPAAAGASFAGSLDFVFSRETKSVALSGACIDPTIYSFPWTETFDNVTAPALPSGWQSIDNNGDGNKWETYLINPLSAPNAAIIYTNHNTSNDDYLVTPPIVLTGGQRLRFWTRAQSEDEPDELSVLLSTTIPTPDAFSNIVMPSSPINFITYTEYVLDLSAYSGTCFIAFARRANPNDGWRLFIDNVSVENIPHVGGLALSPDPLTCGSTYIGVAKRTTVSMTNIGVLPLEISSISLANMTHFQLENLPLMPLTINPGDPGVSFTVVFNPTMAGALSTQLLIGNTPISFEVSGTGVEPLMGDICEAPYLVTLPLVDYQGSTLGFTDNYRSTMFTGLTIGGAYLGGLDWVAKISIPHIGFLNINLADQAGYSRQYMGMVLVKSIPSLASPAPILGQAADATAPLNITDISVTPGDYYLIIDNWPLLNQVYFKLNISFTAVTAAPGLVTMVSPANSEIDVSRTPTLSWIGGAGVTEKYFVSYGKVNPYRTIVDNFDNGLQSTYMPAPLENDTEYWWKIRPWNSVGGSPDESELISWTFTTIQAGKVTIGAGTDSSVFPFITMYEDARMQTLFTADELLAGGAIPGNLERIGYNVRSVGSPAMNSFMVRVKSVPASMTSLTAFVTEGLTTVYGPTTYTVTSTGWNYINFNAPFLWNSVDNLVIDVSFNSDSWNSNSIVYGSAAAGKTWGQRADGGNGNTMTEGSLQETRPNTFLQFSPSSIHIPAAPILSYPADGATGLPKGMFNLSWTPDLVNGAVPDYYEVFLYNELLGINPGAYIWETTSTSLNPATFEGGPSAPIAFEYASYWNWAVKAINVYGYALSEERWFIIESDTIINSFPYLETFEAHADNSLPAGWQRSSNAIGWEFGTNLSSTYWGPPAHTVYAAANDDAAGDGADGSMDLLYMPPVDLSAGLVGIPILSFDSYYSGHYGELAFVEVNTGGVWELLFEVPSDYDWLHHSVSLENYIGESELLIRFHSDDNGHWAGGWAIDNVAIGLPAMDTFPPTIYHDPIIGWPFPGKAIEIWSAVDDDPVCYSGVDYINMLYSVNGGPFITVPMVAQESFYSALIPAQAAGTTVQYYFEASDTAPSPNLAISDIWDFEINSPVTLQYDSGTPTSSIGLSSGTYGVMTGFNNPFGYDHPVKINYVTAGTSNNGTATVHIFKYDIFSGVLVDVIPPFTHYFPANVYQTIPLTDCITTAAPFYVAFTDISAPTCFNYDETQDYYQNTHFIFSGAGYDLNNVDLLVSSGFPGSWMIRANVQDGMPAPEIGITLENGNPQLSWAPVAGANAYIILAANTPDAPEPWDEIGFVTGLNNVFTYTGEDTEKMKFFKVRAMYSTSISTAFDNGNKLSVLPEPFIKPAVRKKVKFQSNQVKH